MTASWAAERSSVFTLKQGAFVSTDRALAIACDMLEGMGHRLAALVAMAAMLGACSTAEELRPIATGSAWGGDTRDGNYDWELRHSRANLTRIELYVPDAQHGYPSDIYARASGSDDVVWVGFGQPVIDAAAIAIGGARGDVDEVILILGDGTEVPMKIFKVEGKSWNALMAELPPKWATQGRFAWEVVALKDGIEILQDEYDCNC